MTLLTAQHARATGPAPAHAADVSAEGIPGTTIPAEPPRVAADDLAAELPARARALGLARDPRWLALLHINGGDTRSDVESRYFFLAADGESDPEAELDATLAAFLDPADRAPRDEPAQCIFGARFHWLDEQLHFDSRMPRLACERREAWMRMLAPDRAWVVFPAAYLNNPSSMFGHTLLRLDGREVRAGTPLLAYAVNFAANSTDTNGALFAVKGLFGGYSGQFSVLPYYEKIREYARLESRDLWEYPLDLDAAQKRMLLLHLWELRGAEFTYYFFTRNCSYELLTLLKVARPDLDWGDAFRWRAIPSDTLRVLGPLLAGPPAWRPALATTVGHQAAQLAPAERMAMLDLAAGRLAPGDLRAEPTARARALGLANDLIFYRANAGELPRDQAIARSQALLRARAEAPAPAGFTPPERPATSPDGGHATRRAVVETGWLGGRPGVGLRLRPAYHDLLDAPAGYGAGQQIGFLDLHLRTDIDGRDARWGIDLVDIVSVAPFDAVFQPISWRVRGAVERAEHGRRLASGIVEGGPGLTLGQPDRLAAYGFAMTRAEANADLDRNLGLAIGPVIGLLGQPLPGWLARVEAGWLRGLDSPDLHRLAVEQRWRLATDLALGLRLSSGDQAGRRLREAMLGLHAYF
ncbi:DUF4105 domain-containing protein [Derxia gummosa]|uniref:DUF4105 domain-containing protein n=1 Tax=Derxia gummosa DSM 723 TaxID=1121388 RepID=A0A8B6XAD1_9BURK|nr:DUF4105 domain-containing protein [Derxia gummosa]